MTADQLAADVLAEARRHPARSPERRAAAHVWAALITSPTVSAARSAIATFGTPQTQAAALELFGWLAAEPAGRRKPSTPRSNP